MSEKKRRGGAGAGAASGSASKKPRVSTAASYAESLRSKLRPDASILATLRSLASACSKSKPAGSSSSASKALETEDDPVASYIVVADQDSASVTSRINRLVLAAEHSVLSGRGFSFAVPFRAASNQVDRIVFVHHESVRPFANVATARKATINARCPPQGDPCHQA